MFSTIKVILTALFVLGTAPGGLCAPVLEEQSLVFNAQKTLVSHFTGYSGIRRPAGRSSGLAFYDTGGWFEWNCDLQPAVYDMTVQRSQPANLVPMTLKMDGLKVATFDTDSGSTRTFEEHRNIEITRQGSKTFRLEVSEDGPEIDSIHLQAISAVASLEDHWYLVRTGVDMTFADDIESEMTISFEVHKLRDPDISSFETQILDWECEAAAEFVTASELTTTTEEASDPNELEVLHLYLNFEEDNFYRSNAWEGDDSEGDIKICVQVDLMYESPDGEETHSISMVRTHILQHVQMIGNFGTDEDDDKGMKAIDAAVIKNRDFESDASVNFDVGICICDDNHECLSPQPEAKMNSFVQFCITSETEIAEIVKVTSFVLEQKNSDGSYFRFEGIDDDGNPREGVTDVVYEVDPQIGDYAVVTQHFFTRFFDQETTTLAPIDVYGAALLRLRDARRHRLVRARMVFDNNDVEEHTMNGRFEQTVELDDGSDAATASNIMLVSALVSLISLLVII